MIIKEFSLQQQQHSFTFTSLLDVEEIQDTIDTFFFP
jgi:hypothetical protein